MSKVISHPWINGGDNSAKPVVTLLANGRFVISADMDCDADGSPRVGSIDPKSGQSSTSLSKDNGWKGPNHYVDSETIPFFVLPLNWTEITGVACKLGCMAKLTFKNKSIYAIFADAGPKTLVGEASICAIEALGGNPWNAAKTKIVSGLPFGVEYEIIPGSENLARTTSYESIQAYGKELFEAAPVPTPVPTDEKVDWLELNRADDGKPAITAYLGETAKRTRFWKTRAEFDSFCAAYPGVNILVAETDKKVIPKCPDLGEVIKPDPKPLPGNKELWIPFAKTPANDPKIAALNKECGGKYPTHGKYDKGYPTGAVVHFTAGGPSGYGTLRYLSGVDDNGAHNYPCLIINPDGTILQAFPLNERGAHSGTWHHHVCVGIEIVAAGRCTKVGDKFKAWFHRSESEYFTRDQVRWADVKDNVVESGYYHKYTQAQEDALVKLLVWFKQNAPNVFDVNAIVGHDEACTSVGDRGRKNDPGGALSMTMTALRKLVASKI